MKQLATPSRRQQGSRIDADYTEDVVGMALESFLAISSFPFFRYSIEPFSRKAEHSHGADALLHSKIKGFRPFYMQFKRPSAYPDFSLAKVVIDRKAHDLEVTPRALYFELRKKTDKQLDFQHNALFRLHHQLQKDGLGDAAYVCPLFLERAAYRFHLHWSGLSLWPRFWRPHPWERRYVAISNGGTKIRFDNLPIFAEHITIPPHVLVTSASHKYSFTENGRELCFHSPESLPEGAATLTTFLNKVAEGFLDGGPKIRPIEANKVLRELIDVSGVGRLDGITSERDDENPIGNWLAWGEFLRKEYGIDQFALVSWDD